jgi:hypothetical protein
MIMNRSFRKSAFTALSASLGPTFRTEVVVPPHSTGALLEHSDAVLLVGSCFSEHIGGRLERAHFDVVVRETISIHHVFWANDFFCASSFYMAEPWLNDLHGQT